MKDKGMNMNFQNHEGFLAMTTNTADALTAKNAKYTKAGTESPSPRGRGIEGEGGASENRGGLVYFWVLWLFDTLSPKYRKSVEVNYWSRPKKMIIYAALMFAAVGAMSLSISHPVDVHLVPSGTISRCNPSHLVKAEFDGAGHILFPGTAFGEWDTSEASEYGCSVVTTSDTATVIAGLKLKSGSFKIYYNGGWSGCLTDGSGTYDGSVVIDVIGDDDDEQGCGGSCDSGSFGSTSTENKSVDFKLFLGRAARDNEGNYKTAGYLRVKAESPSSSLANPSSLLMPYIRSGVERVPADKTQTIQKVKVPEGLVLLVSVNNGYRLECYDLTQLNSSHDPIPNAVPFVQWTLVTGANQNQLQVTEDRGGQQNVHAYTHSTSGSTSGWRLDRPDGSYSVTAKTMNGNDYTKSFELRNADASLVRKTVSTYQYRSSLNDVLITQLVEGDGGVTRTTSYSYYPDDASAQANLLKQVDYPDGGWAYYTYDGDRRKQFEYSPYRNSPPPASGTEPDPEVLGCRKTEYVYDNASQRKYEPVEVIVSLPEIFNADSQTWNMVEASHTYERFTFFDFLSERISTDEVGLVTMTTTIYITDSGSENLSKMQFMDYPDGRLAVSHYDPPNLNGVVTAFETVGEPDGSGGVLNGVQTETQTDNLGRPLAIITRSIESGASGVVLSHQTHQYIVGSLNYSVTDVLANRTTSYDYDCCGLHSVTGPDGVVTLYEYDLLHRQIASKVLRGGSTGVKMTNVLDAVGHVLEQRRIGTDGSTITLGKNQYDILGRVIRQTNALNGFTSTTNVIINNRLIVTNTYPDTGTRIETHYRDGRLESVSGTAVNTVKYLYGVEQDGSGGPWCEFTLEIKVTATGGTNEWVKTYTDAAGRGYKTIYADATPNNSTDNPFTQSFYNNRGQLTKARDLDGVVTLYQYNSSGEREYSAIDLNTTDTTVDGNGNCPIDFSVDRVTRSEHVVLAASGDMPDLVRNDTSVWKDGEATGTLVSRSESATSGLTNWQTVYPVAGIAVTSTNITTYNGNSRTNIAWAADRTSTVSLYSYGRLQSVTRKDTAGNQLGSTTYAYDAHGRQSVITDARTGATTLGYNNADQVTSSTAQGLTTSTEYNTSLRGWRVTQPDFGKVTNEFYLTGQLKKTFGVRTYPVEYTYDYAGRMATMKTWTNYPSGTPAITTWAYDGNRGWLAGKFYANATTGAAQTSVGTIYTYKPSGRLLTRKWARTVGGQPLVTTYGYNGAGDMTTVDYSDSITPDVTYGYDRRGRQITMVQSGGTTTTRAFNDAGQMMGESYAGGPLDGVSVTNVFDGLLRRTNVAILNIQSSILASHGYGYAPTSGRLQTVTDGTHSATYSYLANSPLVSSIVFKQNSTTRMTTTKSYDLLNRLTSISSVPSVSSVVGFTYAYNSAGQRYQVNVVADGETSQWQYGYDTLGQVISGKHLLGGVRLAGEHFEYAFDTIGNRKSTKSGGEASFFYPTTLRSSAYTVNALNQYTTRTVPGYVNVIGVASNGAAKVWVNKQAPERHPIFPTHFRKELPVANTAGPVWLGVTNLAVLNQGSNPDIIATNKGNVLVPMTPEAFTYDLDGNQTSDSLWTSVWNGENRRVVIESSVSSGTGVPAVARAREEWTHLPDGRWIERIVSTNNGSEYVPVLTNRYVWDGNVLLAVLNNVNAVELSFMRGLDLSGTLQGAGGGGGLLAVFSPSTINSQPSTHFAANDGNGNVTMLVNAADGTESARYEYGPFAEPLRMTGPMAKLNPIRYSTQYADDVTGDIKYLFRDYTAGTGRWRSRDPIGEMGGINLQSFTRNNAICRIDRLGLADDDRGVSERYCDAANKYPKNQWLACACRVSKNIDRGIGSMVAVTVIDRLTANDPDYDYAKAGIGKWFICMRSCMVLKWERAFKKWEGQPMDAKEDAKLSPAWNKVCQDCQGEKISETDCCKKQVEAEQGGFDDCTKDCGKWQWGNSFPVNTMIINGWNKDWDFNDLQKRIDYGLNLCCKKNEEKAE